MKQINKYYIYFYQKIVYEYLKSSWNTFRVKQIGINKYEVVQETGMVSREFYVQ